MIVRALATLLVAVSLAGCASSHSVSLTSPADEFSDLNRRTSERLATIRLTDGEKVRAFSFRAMPDSASWLEPRTNTFRTVPTFEVASVTVFKPLKGALTGIGVALGTGVAAGITRALLEGSDEPSNDLVLTQDEKMVAYSLAFSAYSSALTIPVGALTRKETFYFEMGEMSVVDGVAQPLMHVRRVSSR